MNKAQRGSRLQIALVGRCNTGKSSILNRIVGQGAAMVSERPGTTADPVGIPFELLPYGPVTFYDTAGLDEPGELGELRRSASQQIIARADLILIVSDEHGLGSLEKEIITRIQQLETPLLLVCNKQDIRPLSEQDATFLQSRKIPYIETVAKQQTGSGTASQSNDQDIPEPGTDPLIDMLLSLIPAAEKEKTVVADLVPPQGLVVCVVPIDASAPKGRLIVPQVQVLRELADHNLLSLVTQPATLSLALGRLNTPPDLVVTDSQAVKEVAEVVPDSVPLTTFSLLFSRLKGDFALQMQGARAIADLRPDDPVLIAEACSHHAQDDDIAKIKLPRALQKFTGHQLRFHFCSGRDFSDDLSRYKLVLHCGGCMLNAREMRRRLKLCAAEQVPVTNYGMALSVCQGVLERAARPILAQDKKI